MNDQLIAHFRAHCFRLDHLFDERYRAASKRVESLRAPTTTRCGAPGYGWRFRKRQGPA
ncbi:hypothetical protein FHU38_003571 [Saccharomonospora amisosensis]|uniref:Uncharacterized protein n=1 Tax=Saccharomonospora amisosensis TaxID=1128677 RepID=A0A7X5ZRU7_9PSEU|nr:hypothetical protein [Saccharomonospora amisosensis]